MNSRGLAPTSVATIVMLCAAGALTAGEDILRLPIGDPARSGRTAPLVLDGITDTSTGLALTPSELPARLAGVQILFVGESHTTMDTHRVELRVIEELVRAGRKVAIGLEMYPTSQDRVLEDWTSGKLAEAAFVESSGWYRHWSYNWGYYRDIFVFAREKGLRMFGINVPAEVVSTVGRKGLDGLAPEQRALLPERIDWDNADLRRLFKASFDEDEFHGSMPDEMLGRMVQAQATWDAAFGWNAVRAFRSLSDAKTILVVLLGEGHVFYGLGAQRQARLWFDGKTAALVPVAISDRDKSKLDIQSVQASIADFVWGILEEDATLYPSIGLSTRWVQKDNLPEVINVEKKSASKKAGVQVGDRLLELDGLPVVDRESLQKIMAGKRWGDIARLTVRRGDQTVYLQLLFRRDRPGPAATPAPRN